MTWSIIAVRFDTSMRHQPYNAGILVFGQMIGNRLVVDICQEAIQKPGACIVWIPGLIRLCMMNMMRDDIDLFRDHIDGQIPCDKAPELVPECICTMCAIPVIPDGAMRAHDYHAVNKSNPQQVEVEIMEKKEKETGDQQQYLEPVEKGQPILFSSENVQPGTKFF